MFHHDIEMSRCHFDVVTLIPTISLLKVKTDDNLADVFTKAVNKHKIDQLNRAIDLKEIQERGRVLSIDVLDESGSRPEYKCDIVMSGTC